MHKIVFDYLNIIEANDNYLAQIVTRPVTSLFIKAKSEIKSWELKHKAFLNFPLPDHINLLTLTSWKSEDTTIKNKILLRLEVFDVVNKTTETIDIQSFITGITITAVTEVSLTADQTKETVNKNRLQWPKYFHSKSKLEHSNKFNSSNLLTLYVGRINSFILDYRFN